MIHTLAVVLAIGLSALAAKAACNVYVKAGFPKYFGLLVFVPVINLIALYVLAFDDWPIHRQNR